MKSYETIFIFFITLILSITVIYFQNINREWTSAFDMEFTLLYNALLLNDGLSQEYSDHPATTPIILLSIFLNILSFTNILSFGTISELNNSIDYADQIQILIVYTRIFNLIFACIFMIYFYSELKKISKNYILIIFFVLFLIFSKTFLDQTIAMRSEIYSVFFIFISILNFKEFLIKKKYINFTLFNIFLYLAFFSKVQIILYFPFLILFAFLYSNSQIDYNKKIKIFEKKIIFISLIIFLISFALLYLSSKKFHASNASILVLYFIYIFINFILLINFYILNKNSAKFIINCNFVIIFIHIIFIFTFKYLDQFNTQISTFYDILRIKQFAVQSRIDSSILLFNFSDLLINTIKSFKNINIANILIFIFLLTSILFFKKLKLNIYLLIILSIIFIFYSKLLILFRYEHMNIIRYDIYIIPFVIYNLYYICANLKNKILDYSVLLSFVFLLIFNNNFIFYQQYPNNDKNFCNLSLQTESYLDHWHKKIDKNKIYKYCRDK